MLRLFATTTRSALSGLRLPGIGARQVVSERLDLVSLGPTRPTHEVAGRDDTDHLPLPQDGRVTTPSLHSGEKIAWANAFHIDLLATGGWRGFNEGFPGDRGRIIE